MAHKIAEMGEFYRQHRFVLRYFGRIFIVLGVVLASVISVLYNLETRDYLQRIRLREQHTVDMARQLISNEFSAVVADVLFLARQQELHHYLDNRDGASLVACAEEYIALAESRKIYDQVRFIAADGMETVRVNYVQSNGRAYVVPPGKLQNKRGRYYFDDSLALNAGEVFVSPFDLNIEHGQIEQPLKPMIRFGTPVYDSAGHKRGIVLVNYLGQNILDLLRQADQMLFGKMLLLNSDGYWLRGLNAEDEWGFMYTNGSGHCFAAKFPRLWQQICNQSSGQIVSGNDGLFTFAAVYPLSAAATPQRLHNTGTGYHWILLAHIPASNLYVRGGQLLARLLVSAIFLFLLATVPAWFVAQYLARRKGMEMELLHMVHHDRLTGLPNRALLYDRLEQVYHHSKRYKQRFAILFADLDGFKAVNDLHGHDIGDELLVIVAQRLRQVIRRCDTVARVGGDEFVFVVTNIQHEQGAQVLARKIIAKLARPFTVKGITVHIGISIGISHYPEDGDDIEDLIKLADTAMYRAKNNDKGSFMCASDIK